MVKVVIANKPTKNLAPLALLPMGTYVPKWFAKYAHMNPEDMIRAHIDLGQPFTLPSYYDVLKLTNQEKRL